MDTNMNPIKIDRNRWYYFKDVYLNVRSGYYELISHNTHIRSFTDLITAINAAIFQARLDS